MMISGFGRAVVKPRHIKKLVAVSKVETKALQTQHPDLVSKMQTLLTSRAEIATVRKTIAY